MAYQEVSRVEIAELIRRWQAGESIRAIAGALGLGRNTLTRYLRVAQVCGVTPTGGPPSEEQLVTLAKLGRAGPRMVRAHREERLAPWEKEIQRWLLGEKLQLSRVQELLAQRGCIISYMSLHRFVTARGWTRRRTTVRMADTHPGEIAELDFGRLGYLWDQELERRRLVWALVIVLVYSRHQFVWPLFHQQLADVIEGLEAAWAFFQGVPQYVVLDNFPAAVAGADALHPRLTRGFLEYSQHRGFIADPARVRHPQDKPHTERNIQYVRERLFKGGQFRDLADLRIQAREWCLRVAGQRVHGTTRKVPMTVFQEEEQPRLLPWDGEPYDLPEWRVATVHPDHHIAHHYALYSVPYHQCPPGTKVEVRADTKVVRIYHRGTLVKVHPRQPRGGRSTDPEDYPPERTAYALRHPERLRRQAAELGRHVADFAEQLLDTPYPWSKLRQGQKLLRVGERYGAERLDAACQRALEVDLIDVRRVERILMQALEVGVLAQESRLPLPPGRFARPGSIFAVSPGSPASAPPTTPTERRLL